MNASKNEGINILQTNPQKTGHVALKGFFKITDEWGLKPAEQRTLLGDIPTSTFAKYKTLPSINLSKDMLDRISYVMGIYKALRILFPTHDQAVNWVSKANSAYPFNGKSALSFMLGGHLTDLADVRRYLDWQRG